MIQVLHSGTIELVSTDAIVENASDHDTMEYVSETPAVENLQIDDESVENVSDDENMENVSKTPAIENLINDSTGENLSETPAIENLQIDNESLEDVSETPATVPSVSSKVFYSKRRDLKRTVSVEISIMSSKRERRVPKRFE